jgi:hypothetical protein
VAVSDSGLPSMNATQSFQVTVSRPAPPSLTAATVADGKFGFWINGDTGPDYTIQASTNLTSWSPVVIMLSPAMPRFWSDTNTGGAPMQFYRALLSP